MTTCTNSEGLLITHTNVLFRNDVITTEVK